MTSITQICDLLKNERINANMTIREVADFVGCSPAAISQWENGMRQPRFEIVENIAACYGLICTVRLEVDEVKA